LFKTSPEIKLVPAINFACQSLCGLPASDGVFLEQWRAGLNYPYIIMVNDEQAGYAGVGTDTVTREFYIQQLWVADNYRSKGICAKVAIMLFERFAGSWRVESASAPEFWQKVLPEYARNHQISLVSGQVYYFARLVNIDLPDVEVPVLRDDELELTLLRRTPGNRERMWIPAYEFVMNVGGQKVGRIDLRVGNSFPIIAYNGHIGYGVDQQFRGRHYAARACRLLLPLARANGMDSLWITANPDNYPSRRTIESLGARLVEIIQLPEDSDPYRHGDYAKCRYRLEV